MLHLGRCKGEDSLPRGVRGDRARKVGIDVAVPLQIAWQVVESEQGGSVDTHKNCRNRERGGLRIIPTGAIAVALTIQRRLSFRQCDQCIGTPLPESSRIGTTDLHRHRTEPRGQSLSADRWKHSVQSRHTVVRRARPNVPIRLRTNSPGTHPIRVVPSNETSCARLQLVTGYTAGTVHEESLDVIERVLGDVGESFGQCHRFGQIDVTASKSGRHPRKSPAQVTSQCNHFLRGVLRNAQYRRDLHVRELTPKSLIDSNRGILLTTVQVQRSDRVDLEEVGARDFRMLPKQRARGSLRFEHMSDSTGAHRQVFAKSRGIHRYLLRSDVTTFNRMTQHPTRDQPYFGIAIFELGKNDGVGCFYREDCYLIWAGDPAEAQSKFERKAGEQEYPLGASDDQSYVKLAHLVDLAPVSEAVHTGTADLYSRHFSNIAAYRTFETLLGGDSIL